MENGDKVWLMISPWYLFLYLSGKRRSYASVYINRSVNVGLDGFKVTIKLCPALHDALGYTTASKTWFVAHSY